MGKFKVGDRVNWTQVRGEFDGSTIEAIDGAGTRCGWPVTIRAPNGHSTYVDFEEIEPAPLFAVGDKVRVDWPVDMWRGDAVVEKIGDYCIVVKYANGRRGGFDASNLTLLPHTYHSCAAAEVDNLADEYGGGKFDDGGPYNEPKARVRSLVNQFDVTKGRVYEVNEVDGKSVWITDDVGDDFYLLKSEFEHVAVAPATVTTLTIQAGRYYKTRDGRKVGPMVEHDLQECFESDDLLRGGLWKLDGSAWFDWAGKDGGDSPDLIAEWPVEVVASVVAPATTAKLKVGDRVRVVRHCNWRGNDITMGVPVGAERVIVKQTAQLAHEGVDTFSLNGDDRYFYTALNLELAVQAPTTIADIVRKHSGTAMPGSEFGVYTCVDVKKVERVYDHEWKRLAASGQRIEAIKAYRDAGGKRETFVSSEFGYRAGYENRFVIGLKEAKDAVEYWLASAA